MINSKTLSRGLILVALILFPLLTTACGGESQDTFVDEPVQAKRVGILRSLGGMTVGDGTHLLEVTNGITMRLKSSKINLDNEKYLSKKVEVRGLVSKTSDGKEIMDVSSIDLSEDEEEEDATKGTDKEYKDADLGFTITYLDSWEVDQTETGVVFTAPKVTEEEVDEEMTEDETVTTLIEYDPDVVSIEQIPNPQKKSLEMFLYLPSDPNELITLGYTETSIGKDDLEGLQKQSSNMQEIDMWLVRDTFVYHFSFVGTDNSETVNNRNIFFGMISSFQFIGFVPEDEEEDVDETVEPETEPVEPDTANNMIEKEVFTPETDQPTIITPEEKVLPITSSSSYGIIAQYIGETINSIAPESSDSGTWGAYSFEFVDPNYVYTDYTDGSVNRRVLLSYEQDGAKLSTNVEAYFEPGETTSWTRVSGENPVENAEKTIVSLTDEGAQEAAVVKEGYRYFESLPYDFLAQYPSSWYFSGHGGSEDVIHHYGFSNEPVEDGNELVSIDIVSGSLPAGSSISVGSHSAVKVYSNGEVAIYIQRDDGKLYKVHGSSGYEAQVVDIAASISAN